MPRNRYTRLVRISQRAQLAHQERQLIQLIHQLRCGETGSLRTLPVAGAKQRRSARLAKNRLHKPARPNHDTETTTA